MCWKLSGKVIFTAAYLLMAAIFLTIHFTRMEEFGAIVGNAEVKGYSSLGTAFTEPSIRRINLDWEAIKIDIRSNNNVLLITQDRIRHKLNILGWSISGNSLRVDLSEGTGLLFELETDNTGLRLTLIIPETSPPAYALEMPFHPKKFTQFENSPRQQAVLTPDKSYSLTLSSGSNWDEAGGKLLLAVQEDTRLAFELIGDSQYRGAIVRDWWLKGAVPSQDDYQKTVDQWLRKVRENWRTLWNTQRKLIEEKEGYPARRDLFLAAILADAANTGELRTTLPQVLSESNRMAGKTGWLLSPYLGDIVNQSRVHSREMNEVADILTGELAAGNPVFDIPFSLTYLIDTGHDDDALKLVTKASELPNDSILNEELIDRLSLIHEAINLDMRNPDLSVISIMINDYLLERMKWINERLWLLEKGNSVDVRLSLRASRLLLRQAEYSNEDIYRDIGRQMMISLLAHAGENGRMPQTLRLQRDGEIVEFGLIANEEVYSVINGIQAYPRHVSLARELSQGAWMLTCAKEFTLRHSARETNMTVLFPAGGTHHIAIRGVRPFNTLYLNGIVWNQDPNFQRYYGGWFYDRATETLYIKIYHRAETEIIRILY